MFVRCMWVPTEVPVEGGHQTPWSWTVRQSGCWDPALSPLEEQTSGGYHCLLFSNIFTCKVPLPLLPQALPLATHHTLSSLLYFCFKIACGSVFCPYLGLCTTCVSGAQEGQKDKELHRLPPGRQADRERGCG